MSDQENRNKSMYNAFNLFSLNLVSVISFSCKGNYFISREGITFSVILIFRTSSGLVNPGSLAALLVCVCVQGRGAGVVRRASLGIQQRKRLCCH